MLNVTLEESDCFASWMVAEDVPSLPMQDPKKGFLSYCCFILIGEKGWFVVLLLFEM